MEVGTKIRVNKGQVETLIKIHDGLGLFKCKKYQVVRALNKITKTQIIL